MIMALVYLHTNDISYANIKRSHNFLVKALKPVLKLANFAITVEDDSITLRKLENYAAPKCAEPTAREGRLTM